MEVVASLSQGRTAAAQCGLFTHKNQSRSYLNHLVCIFYSVASSSQILSSLPLGKETLK